MYSKETFEIAQNLWRNDGQMDKLIAKLQAIRARKHEGIQYSYEDFDIKQNLAAELHSIGKL
jgi:hypothetical protein